jgi:hypothetical protein
VISSPVQVEANGKTSCLFSTTSLCTNAHRYACPNDSASSKFVGCCVGGDPCSKGCADGNLRPAAFNASDYGNFPDASCGTNSNFFTCSSGATFWGCCKSVACALDPPACSSGNLTAAFIDQPAQSNFYLGQAGGSSPNASGGGKSNGAVIGGAVGGALGGLLIIGLLGFLFWRRRRQNQQTTRVETAEVGKPMMDGRQDPHSPNFAAQSRKCYSRPSRHNPG